MALWVRTSVKGCLDPNSRSKEELKERQKRDVR